MLTNLKKVGISAMLFAPYVALAADQADDIGNFLTKASGWITTITTIVVGLVFIYFMWGLITYLVGGAEKKEEAKGQMIYSILIMFVIFSIWGIIQVLNNITGTTGTTAKPVDIPNVTP